MTNLVSVNLYYVYVDHGYISERLISACTTLEGAISLAKNAANYEVFIEGVEVLTFAEGELECHFKTCEGAI